MASTTFTVITPALAGTTIVGVTAIASSNTVTIQASTAQSALDLSSLNIRVENQSTTASVSLSLAASSHWSEHGQGAKTITIGTATTIIIGGQDFEDARFCNTAGTIVFTQTGTGATSWEAYMAPRVTQ